MTIVSFGLIGSLSRLCVDYHRNLLIKRRVMDGICFRMCLYMFTPFMLTYMISFKIPAF